jgi:heat-inducible transcriptional repressor
VGFAVAPDSGDAAFHQIDFVPLTGSKVLVVVVAHGGQVSNKVVDIGEILDPMDLRQAANSLSTEFGGLPLSTVRRRVLEELEQDRTLCDALLRAPCGRPIDVRRPPQSGLMRGPRDRGTGRAGDRVSIPTLRA